MATKKRNRPKIYTKEQLIDYLEKNPETEQPFRDDVWALAVEKTKDKELKQQTIEKTDFDGNTKKKVVPNGSYNPVSMYFQLISLPQYNKPKVDLETESIFAGINIDFDDSQKNEKIADWITVFFSDYKTDDKKFLVSRLGDYYDNYDINSGADIMMVVKVCSDELEMMKLTKERAKGKDIEARLEKVQKGYLSLLDGLKAMKNSKGKMDNEGKNKFTVWLDEMEKTGDFHYDFGEIGDEIDDMLDSFYDTIVRTLGSG